MKNHPTAVQVDSTVIDIFFTNEDSSALGHNCKLITYQDCNTGVILDYSLQRMSRDGVSDTDEERQLSK